MKDPIYRTKVVLRHLPPSLSQSALMEQVDGGFAGRYKWVSFRPGRHSQKHQKYSRAYIDFKRSEDVIEFAKFFDGHMFVNEKGAQFKIIVEYAPSQRVPKPCSKKNSREGTIFKDSEYLEFLVHLARPVENLPSAEVQLEKREAERTGAMKETPIVTPLMDFVRQKRASKSASQRSSSSGKLSRRSGGSSTSNVRSATTKRGSEKRRASSSMYVPRDSSKNASGKEKSNYILVQRRENQWHSDNAISPAATTDTGAVEEISVQSNGGAISRATVGTVDIGKKKVSLLKGKERETANEQMSEDILQHQAVLSPVGHSAVSTGPNHSQRHDSSGKMIKSTEKQIHTVNLEKEKQPPRSASMRSTLKDQHSTFSRPSYGSENDSKGVIENNGIGTNHSLLGTVNKNEAKHTRNKDTADHGIWTVRCSEASREIDEQLSFSSSIATQTLPDSLVGMGINQQFPATPEVSKHSNNFLEGSEFITKSSYPSGKSRNLYTAVQNSRLGRGGSSSVYDLPLSLEDVKVDMSNSSRCGEVKTVGRSRNSLSPIENGSHRHVGRRGHIHAVKNIDVSLYPTDIRPSKRGGSTGHGSHEKQVWVQKSGSGS